MSTSNLNNNISEKITEKPNKCKYLRNYEKVTDNLLIYNCVNCNKYFNFNFDQNLTNRFKITNFLIVII